MKAFYKCSLSLLTVTICSALISMAPGHTPKALKVYAVQHNGRIHHVTEAMSEKHRQHGDYVLGVCATPDACIGHYNSWQ